MQSLELRIQEPELCLDLFCILPAGVCILPVLTSSSIARDLRTGYSQ